MSATTPRWQRGWLVLLGLTIFGSAVGPGTLSGQQSSHVMVGARVVPTSLSLTPQVVRGVLGDLVSAPLGQQTLPGPHFSAIIGNAPNAVVESVAAVRECAGMEKRTCRVVVTGQFLSN